MTYSPGWSVLPQTLVRKERWPGGDWLRALPLVVPGQEVLPDQPVMRLLKAEQVTPVAALSAQPYVSLNEELEKSEFITIPAGLSGRVIDVTQRGGLMIESRSALVPGAVGSGGQVAGVLTLWQPEQSKQQARVIPPGAILVVPGPVNLALLSQALRSSVSGVVASSISLADLEGFLHTDFLQLLSDPRVESAQTHLPPLTLLFTEGIGSFAMPRITLDLLNQYQGSIALLSGTTSLPRGLFPELIISLRDQHAKNWQPAKPATALVPGGLVRICAGEHEGELGVIDYLFIYERVFPSGIRSRAARVHLETGPHIVVPIPQVERVG